MKDGGDPGLQEGSQEPAAPGIHLGPSPWQPRHMAPSDQNKLKPHFKARPTNQVFWPNGQLVGQAKVKGKPNLTPPPKNISSQETIFTRFT